MILADVFARLKDNWYVAVGGDPGSGFFFMGPRKNFEKEVDRPEQYMDRKVLRLQEGSVPGEPYMIKVIIETWDKFEFEVKGYSLLSAYNRAKHGTLEKPRPVRIKHNLESLTAAIIVDAVREYEKTIRAGKPSKSLEDYFLHSEDYKLLSGDDSGWAVIEGAHRRVRYTQWRKEKGCPRCKVRQRDCRHRVANAWESAPSAPVCVKEKEEESNDD